MNWLLDAQFSPHLCEWFRSKGDSYIHVGSLKSGLSEQDEILWNYSRDNGYAIVSKDKDFFERALLLGMPPPVLMIRLGNCSNEYLH